MTLLIVVYVGLQVACWLNPPDSSKNPVRSRDFIHLTGRQVNERDFRYAVATLVSTLAAHTLIAMATWYFTGGWHGVFALLLVVFTFIAPVASGLGVPNMASAVLQNRIELFVWFDLVVCQYLLGFVVALTLKPIFLWSRQIVSGKPKMSLNQLMWLTVAIAVLLGAWNWFAPGLVVASPLQRYLTASLIGCAAAFVIAGQHRKTATILLLMAIVAHLVTLGLWDESGSSATGAGGFM